jgi:hypothetical protein
MTTDEALRFLRSHQPLPPTREIGEDLLKSFNEIRKYFITYPDIRSIPLFLNSFGEGDGHGIYQLVEDVILSHPEDVVVPALLDSMRNPLGSVRYWSAQIAANYKNRELVTPLADILRGGNIDERIAAVTALEAIGLPEAMSELEIALNSNVEDEVKDMIRDALGI